MAQSYREYLYSLSGDEARLGAISPSERSSGARASSFKPPASEINKVEKKTNITKSSVLASEAVAPVCFGEDRYFAKTIFPHVKNDILYISYLVSWGDSAGIEAINKTFIDGINVNKSTGFLSLTGTAINKYLGAPGQTVDPMMSAALPGFSDNYPTYSYLVVKAPVGSSNGFPRVEVEVNGVKIPRYDTHSPFEITNSTIGDRNMLTNSADLSLWTLSGTPTVTVSGQNGSFKTVRVASGGSSLDGVKSVFLPTHRCAVTLYVSKLEGTGSFACIIKDENAGTISLLGGPVGSEYVWIQNAGALEIYESRDLEEYSVFRFFFTPTNIGNVFSISLGPGTPLTGSYSTFLGVQVESTLSVDNSVREATSNPINIHAYLSSRAGESIDPVSARQAAIWNNDVLPGAMNSPRRYFGRVYDQPEEMGALLESIRAYTGCAIVWREGLMRYVPYRNSLIKSTHVTNGTFDSSISSWSDVSVAPSSVTWDSVDKTMRLTANAADAIARQKLEDAGTVIKNVAIKFYCHGKSTIAPTVKVGSAAGLDDLGDAQGVIGDVVNFSVSVPAGTELWIDFIASGSGDCYVDTIDAFSYGPQHYLDSSNIRSIKPARRNSKQSPNKIVIEFTDDSKGYQQAVAVQRSPELSEDPSIVTRLSRITMAGFHSYNCANREAIERLNSFLLSDLLAEVVVFDEGLLYEIGDVCSVTHPIGLSGKLMYISTLTETTAGDWILGLAEWDPLLYSSKVESNPTYADTNLPLHEKPLPPTNLTLVEELYKRRDGKWDNRIRAEWDPSDSPYVIQYEVQVREAGVSIHSALEKHPVSVFGPLNEGVLYTVEVYALTSLFRSDAVSSSITPLGKVLIPGDVENFSAYEVGGEVRFAWDAAEDLDIVAYEIRYGSVGVTWDSAVVVDRIAALRYKTKEIPPGTFDFLIKAVDSVNQFSENASRVSSLLVTLDSDAYLVDNGVYPDASVSATLGHIVTEVRGGGEIIYTNTSSQTWSALFGAATLNSKTNPLASYQTVPGTPFSWTSDEYDLTLDVAGDFRQFSDVKQYAGSAIEEMGLRVNAGSTVWYTETSKKTIARYGKMRVSGNGLVRVDTHNQLYRVDATTRKESGNATTSGASGVTINLDNVYSKVKLISITVDLGGATVGYTGVVDNVTLGDPSSFDVFIFDSSDVRVSKNFYWTFEGV